MSLDEFFTAHSWSPETQKGYRRMLTMFLEDVRDPQAMQAVDFKAWLEGHETWGENTRWLAYVAVRNYLRWRYGRQHPALRYRFRRREQGKPQRTLTYEQITRLVESLDTTTVKGRRDLALVLFMLDTGVRASEVCRLERQYLDLQERRFAVLGKGGRWREGVFGQQAAQALEQWLAVSPPSKAVFVSIGGKTPGRPLTPSGLKIIFRKLGKQAGIGLISPHDFRRTFATLAIRAGAPTRLVQVAGGWRSLEMVERYSRALVPQDFQQFFPVEQVLK